MTTTDGLQTGTTDGLDPDELRDWLDAFRDVLAVHGPERAAHLLESVVAEARLAGAPVSVPTSTPYVNTIPVEQEPPLPGDPDVERRLRSIVRWNAAAMVLRANMSSPGIGGHIASFQSAATLYETGFNHFWHAPTDERPGDLVYMQGHSSPGIYARAFLEGRIDEEQLRNFRRETDRSGLSSYPAPVADAGVLALPHGLDGPRADHGDLPGALSSSTWSIAGSCRRPAARSGPTWATGRWTSRSRWARSRSPRASASTTSCSSSTATCSASTARCAGTARSSRSSRPASAAPAGT